MLYMKARTYLEWAKVERISYRGCPHHCDTQIMNSYYVFLWAALLYLPFSCVYFLILPETQLHPSDAHSSPLLHTSTSLIFPTILLQSLLISLFFLSFLLPSRHPSSISIREIITCKYVSMHTNLSNVLKFFKR